MGMVRSLRSLASPLCLLGLMGTFHIQAATLAHAPAVPAVSVVAAAAPAAGSSSARRRCNECGVILAMREVGTGNEPSAGARELTLGYPDGSQRVITDAKPAAWKLGERMSVIDGMQ